MIEYKEIPIQKVEVFHPDGSLLANVTEHELYDIRLQIKNQEIDGYFVLYDDGKVIHHINIFTNGRLSDWPKGFFDLTDYYLCLLLDWDEPKDSTISP